MSTMTSEVITEKQSPKYDKPKEESLTSILQTKNDKPKTDENSSNFPELDDPHKKAIEEGTEIESVVNRIASIKQNLQSEDKQTYTKKLNNSPGKIKHNLNINVNALRPGFGPPKPTLIPKSHSLDLPSIKTDAVETKNTLSFANIHQMVDEAEDNKNILKTEGEVEVLHSLVKDRVRIPVKRRPSTRRGRQEAIRKSAADIDIDFEDDFSKTFEINTKLAIPETDNQETQSSVFNKKEDFFTTGSVEETFKAEITENARKISDQNISSTNDDSKTNTPSETRELKSEIKQRDILISDNKLGFLEDSSAKNIITKKEAKNILFQEDEEEEFLFSNKRMVNIPANISVSDPNTKDVEKREKDTNLFSDSDDDLFSNDRKKVTKKDSRHLFDSEDESDEDLFKKPNKTSQAKNTVTSAPSSQSNVKSSLFHDSSSEEDLFSSSKRKQKDNAVENRQKGDRSTHFATSRSEETTEDPLSKFL